MGQQVAVIDYGMGNIHSIDKALRAVAPNDEITLVSEPAAVANAERVVFPGVGAIGDCIAALDQQGLTAALRQAAQEKPLLAICVGMQALFGENEETAGSCGLEILPGKVKRLPSQATKTASANAPNKSSTEVQDFKVPHMGWNKLQMLEHPLFYKIAPNSYFYFLHSYYCAGTEEIAAAKCVYSLEFTAAVLSGNIFATQFHPEKSQADGLQLLKNFFQWPGAAAC